METMGTPIQSTSVVVPPVSGNGSSAMSMVVRQVLVVAIQSDEFEAFASLPSDLQRAVGSFLGKRFIAEVFPFNKQTVIPGRLQHFTPKRQHLVGEFPGCCTTRR